MVLGPRQDAELARVCLQTSRVRIGVRKGFEKCVSVHRFPWGDEATAAVLYRMLSIPRRFGRRYSPLQLVDVLASTRRKRHVLGGQPSRPALSSVMTQLQRTSSTTATTRPLYLHVGPSGECWTGDEIFAAKHLQPDYVKSILLPPNVDPTRVLELVEADVKLGQRIYDEARLPPSLISALDDTETRP
jgi:hypothetical protein